MKHVLLIAVFLGALVNPAPAAAVMIGIPDLFSTDLEGWFAGGGPVGQVPPNSPVHVADGGPGGVGDGFMQVNSTGQGGPGGRLVAMNLAQWAGDYTTIGSIRMDVRNLGTTDLTLRLYLENPIPGPPTDDAVTAPTAVLPAGGGWQTVFFSLAPASLTLLNGNLNALLANVTVLRLMHNAAAGFPPGVIAASLGVDNIVAVEPDVAVPEPGLLALLLAGGAAWARRRR